jgi:hypothetical protein
MIDAGIRLDARLERSHWFNLTDMSADAFLSAKEISFACASL